MQSRAETESLPEVTQPAGSEELPPQALSGEENATASQAEMQMPEHEALITGLIEQTRKQRRLHKNIAGLFGLGYLLSVFYRILSRTFQFHLHLPGAVFWTVMLLGLLVVTAEIVLRLRLNKAVKRITAIDDVRAIGVLATGLDSSNRKVQAQLRAALTPLLPRLRAEDAWMLREEERTYLYHELRIENAQDRSDFLIALLDALERVGDARALPAIETMASILVTSTKGRLVQAAARKCLPILRARVQEQELSGTLLRASSAANAPDTNLLRPAHGGNDDPPDQLLRATSIPRPEE